MTEEAKAKAKAEAKAKLDRAINNAKSKAVLHVPAAIPDDPKHYLTTRVRFCKGGTESVDVRFHRVRTEEECQRHYGCSLIEMLDRGIKQIMTLPNYRIVAWDENGNLLSDAGKKTQAFVDDYHPAKPSEAGAKAREAKATQTKVAMLAAEKGMTIEELILAAQKLPGKK